MGGLFGRNKISPDDARALISCAALTVHNEGRKAAMSFALPKNKAEHAKQVLAKDWNITDWGTSLVVLELLSKAQYDGLIIAEIFGHIIAQSQYEITRGIFTSVKQDVLPDLDLPHNFVHLWEAVTNNANSDIDAFMHFLSGADDANKTFHSITASALVNRINSGITGYEQAIRTLIVYGYSMEELSKIDNFSAWDLGRTGHIAKMAALAGFIDEPTVHQYMLSAGKRVYKAYVDWRQFLAAYFIGHSIVGGNPKEIGSFGDTIQYLLKNKKSPYQKFPLKETA